MTPRIADRMSRIRKYFTRVLNHMGDGASVNALAAAAELNYQTGELYKEIEKYHAENRTPQTRDQETESTRHRS